MYDTTDEKIHQLVGAVLEAVDERLDRMRHELAEHSSDVERQHHQVLATIAALTARVDQLSTRASPPPATREQPVPDNADRMEQATKVLIDRIESSQRNLMSATNQRLTQMNERLEELRSRFDAPPARPVVPDAPPTIAPNPSPPLASRIAGPLPHLTNAEFDQISRPLISHNHIANHVTSQVAVPAPAADGAIDMDRLTSLLTEKLGHLALPSRPSTSA